MEEVFLRFPHLGKKIFEQIGNEDLNKCTAVDKYWNKFISSQKMPWIRMINKYVDCSKAWLDFFRKSNIETINAIARTMAA